MVEALIELIAEGLLGEPGSSRLHLKGEFRPVFRPGPDPRSLRFHYW